VENLRNKKHVHEPKLKTIKAKKSLQQKNMTTIIIRKKRMFDKKTILALNKTSDAVTPKNK